LREELERLIEELDAYFFKEKRVTTVEFADDIIQLSEMCDKLNTPIDKLFKSVSEKRQEKDKLIDEIDYLGKEKLREIQDAKTTSKDLEEYRRNRPIIEHSKRLERSFHLADFEKEEMDKKLKQEKLARIHEQSLRQVNEHELQKAYMKRKERAIQQYHWRNVRRWSSNCCSHH
jgi:hypothetical protein